MNLVSHKLRKEKHLLTLIVPNSQYGETSLDC
jgi:hypothetical protein